MTGTALAGARVFDGSALREGVAVIIEGSRIAAVVAERDVPASVPTERIDGLLAPGFIDIQVNGGGGVLFNDDRSMEAIAAIGAAHRPFGTTGFLPTLVTDTRATMAEAVAAANAALAARVPGLLGLHLEGPFLSPERKGIHAAALMRVPDEEDLRAVTSLVGGKMLITLAPEKVPPEVIARLAAAGCILSAGHTAASYADIVAARAAGLTGFTHLFNAMPPLAGREPGPVGAAMDDPGAWASIIVDLIHVSAPSLRAAIAARGYERTILTSDAMPTVGSSADGFVLHGRKITLSEGKLAHSDGTLAGAHLDMATAVRNAIEHLGVPLEAALHMASRAPAEFLGLGAELGRISPGYRASLLLLDDDLAVTGTWIDGAVSTR
jgi:N-acetylglucosamine-6-phosphate deacetylase